VQEEEDGVEAVAVGPGRAAAAEAVGVDALRQVVAQLLPQVVGDEPLGGRRLQLLRVVHEVPPVQLESAPGVIARDGLSG
jgi:hypothetical protein